MRYFIDTEYNWDHESGTITPISIGIVAEDGREFYAVDANWKDWSTGSTAFVDHIVVPALEPVGYHDPCFVHGERATIARDIKTFIADDDDPPDFWGDYANFDYVVLSMIMGNFDEWPDRWPMFINDCQSFGVVSRASEQPHNALADARAVRDGFSQARYLTTVTTPEPAG